VSAAHSLAEIFAEHGLRPRSQAAGHTEKLVCPCCGGGRSRENSLSLSIDTDGMGAVWKCHRGHCGWTDGGRIQTELRTLPARRSPVSLASQKPEPHPVEEQVRDERLYGWFEARGIGQETVDAFRCYGASHWFANGGQQWAVVFPYYHRGELVNRKFRSADKQMMQDRAPIPTLFNIDAIESPDEVIWVEGEPDVMALHEAGFRQAVTLKDGAPDRLRAENDPARLADKRFAALGTHEDLLSKVKKFYLAGDMDEPGQALREELARRLGKHRCWIVTWPEGCKDAGDTLARHGAEAIHAAIAAATPIPIDGIQFLGTGTLLKLRHGHPPEVLTTGAGATDQILALPGEGRLIVVTGIPNHGKSSWVMFVKVHLMAKHNRRFVVFSPEMQPWESYVAQCVQIRSGKPFWPRPDCASMSDQEISEAEEWFRERMIMLVCDAEDDAPTLDWLLERTRIALLRHGITDLLIDPWNEIEHQQGNLTETQYVGRCLQRLRSFALRHGVNVWIVAHPTKLQPEKPGGKVNPPGMYDINGGANWANKADLGITVHTPKGITEIHLNKARFRRWGRRGVKAELEFNNVSGRYSTPTGYCGDDE